MWVGEKEVVEKESGNNSIVQGCLTQVVFKRFDLRIFLYSWKSLSPLRSLSMWAISINTDSIRNWEFLKIILFLTLPYVFIKKNKKQYFRQKYIVRKVALFCNFANFFVWVSRKQLDSHIWFYIQSVKTYCIGWSIYTKIQP